VVLVTQKFKRHRLSFSACVYHTFDFVLELKNSLTPLRVHKGIKLSLPQLLVKVRPFTANLWGEKTTRLRVYDIAASLSPLVKCGRMEEAENPNWWGGEIKGVSLIWHAPLEENRGRSREGVTTRREREFTGVGAPPLT